MMLFLRSSAFGGVEGLGVWGFRGFRVCFCYLRALKGFRGLGLSV